MTMVSKAALSEPLTIPASEFKAKCLKLMDESVITQKTIAITKGGKVVGHFVPAAPAEKPFRSIVGRSPASQIPGEAEWTKLKSEWAREWDRSADNLAS
jgi:hypothetical protein